MNAVKIRFLMLGMCVLALGTALGTTLWTKLGPQPRYGSQDQRPLEHTDSYGLVPDFTLVERNGKEINLAHLRGTIWIADFIYTSCNDTCPLQTAEMAKLQGETKDRPDLRLVSFSVDPDKDTPGVLTRYADRFGADASRWLFLTGPKGEITRLIREGFRLSAAFAVPGGEKADDMILHSTRFVLVDKQARIRGYYDSRDAEALQRLRRDISALVHG